MLHGHSDSRARFPCEACGETTEVSVHVHAEVPVRGLTVSCWACGEPLLIQAHPSTIEGARRDRKLLSRSLPKWMIDAWKRMCAEDRKKAAEARAVRRSAES